MTGRAAAVALCGGLTVVAGLLLRWPEALAIGTGLAVLVLLPQALRRPRTVRWWDVSAPVRVARGEPAAIVVGVEADGSTTWVSAVDGAGTDRVWVPRGSGPITLTWPVETSRRGLIGVGPSRLEWGDPFGIVRRTLAVREPSPVLIVPRVRQVDARPAPGRREEGESAERAGSDQFHSLREYAVGDPMKSIHWRSSARTGRLMVRRMVDTTTPWLLVALDVNERSYDRPGALFDDFDADAFEEAVDTAASWAWWGCGPQQRVLLTTTSLSSEAASAEVTARTRDSALDWLALVTTDPAGECGPARVEALMRRTAVARLVLVTGGRPEVSQPWVATWRRTLPVTVVTGRP